MKTKILIWICSFILIIASLLCLAYIKFLPDIIQNQKFINFVQKEMDKQIGVKSVIKSPMLKTHFSPNIEFSIDELELTGPNGKIIEVNNFKTAISFKELISKKIILKELGANYIFADSSKFKDLSFRKNDKKNKKENNWKIDIFDSVLYVKNALILHNVDKTELKLIAEDLKVDNTQKDQRFVNFKIKAEIKKEGKTLRFDVSDNNGVYFKDKHFWVKNCALNANNSKIYFNAQADKKQKFILDVYSDNIDINDVLTLIDSQLIENNLEEPLSYFKDISGNFKFNIEITNDNINGTISLNKLLCKIIPVNNIPLTFEKGNINLTKEKITLKDFEGFYNNKRENVVSMEVTVDDYLKTIDTKLTGRAVVSNDFMKNYLSPMIGTPIELTGGNTKTKLELNAINNKIDMNWLFGVKPGQDILVDGSSLSPVDYARGVKGDMHFEDNLLTIRSLDYYIIPEQYLNKENIRKIKPIMKFKGNIDIANHSEIKDLGFQFTHPLPSEFLNIFIGERFFKGGKIAGEMYYVNQGKYPELTGNLTMDEVRIPSQRVFLKHGEIDAQPSVIKILANGGYRRSKYNLDGIFLNEIKFPIVAKDINLSVDNIDVEKFIASANNQNSQTIQSEKFDLAPSGTAKDEDDNHPTFDIGNFVVEKCLLKIAKGHYKDINFSDIEANMTLDKNSVLDMQSNDFAIANGNSSAKINCNLKQHKYKMDLNIKEVDSDIIATNLLQLQKEISGKASGLISLNTDESLKLNGSMKFEINNGTIQKVGLVEYILKFAALFRNPLTMISPSVISDLVNVPDGKFENINGKLELKDNVIERMMIKSTASQLSSFIVGKFDLETRDATLRIYTKFSSKNKGLFGILRYISLNSLASRIPFNAKNDSNYYAAELEQIPPIDADEKDCQVFLTKVDGDVEHNNFISSLKKIK